MHSFRDAGINPTGSAHPTMAFADAASKWNFAWALHAGLAYEVTQAFKVELGLSLPQLGWRRPATSSAVRRHRTTVDDPMHFKDITSHDVKFGVRWMLQPEPVYQPPLMRRG